MHKINSGEDIESCYAYLSFQTKFELKDRKKKRNKTRNNINERKLGTIVFFFLIAMSISEN